MNILPFPAQGEARGWQSNEVRRVVDACAPFVSRGDVTGWEVGETEAGDPQLYLMGPAPEHDCVLCVSRLGRLYVLEDGNGRVVFEHDAIVSVAERVGSALRSKKAAMTARATVAWLTLKETLTEKLMEPMEFMHHIGPQIAALV